MMSVGRGSRRVTVLLVAVVVAGLAVGVTLLGGALASGESGPGASAAVARGPVVGTVTAVAGTRLYVKRHRGGELTTLVKGGRVFLQDIIAVGPGTRATFRLSVPKGVSDDAELLSLYKQLADSRPSAAAVVKQISVLVPIVRTKRTLKLERSGAFIEATLSR